MSRSSATESPGLAPAATKRRGALLVSVEDIASALQVSSRHVHRLHLSGRMPRALRLGWLLRWRREEIEVWIAKGCPARGNDVKAAAN